MANEEQLRILKEHGAEAWNDRRGEAGEETRIVRTATATSDRPESGSR